MAEMTLPVLSTEYLPPSQNKMNRRTNQAVTVSDINKYVKSMFTHDYLLTNVTVKGEVSNCKYHSTGHIYFSLKDAGGSLSCVMFAGNRRGLAFAMRDGQQVLVSGHVDVFERDGRYQLYAKQIQEDGLGLLYERFLLLKEELESMGMFDPQYKKPIPPYARRVGVVTASTGAVIRDIENISHRRNPFVQLILCPAQVQGEGAAESICMGIRRLEKEQVDVIIVGRGGGSMEDLWAFNERIVAETIFSCPIPIISAVGHETDTTISDYAADLRAPTPSAAAELAVWDLSAYEELLEGYHRDLMQSMNLRILEQQRRLSVMERHLFQQSPETKLRELKYRFETQKKRMEDLMQDLLRARKQAYLLYVQKLEGASPLKKLESGYSYTETQDGKALKSISQVQNGDTLTIHVTDGTVHTVVQKTQGKEN